MHLPGIQDEWTGVHHDRRYIEKGRGFNRAGQGRMRLRKVKWLAVNCVHMQVAVKQEIPQTGSPRVSKVARMWLLCAKRDMRESCLSYQGK